MNPIEDLVRNFQELVNQVPEFIQPFVVMLAGAIPFIDGEGAAVIGIVGGIHPVVAGVAAAIGNFLSVLVVVLLSSSARGAVVNHRTREAAANAAAMGGAGAGGAVTTLDAVSAKPESKGQIRFKRWLIRFGVPGASILGPLAIPGQFTSVILVAGGTSKRWVLLWQAVSIVLWTALLTGSVWATLTYVVGI